MAAFLYFRRFLGPDVPATYTMAAAAGDEEKGDNEAKGDTEADPVVEVVDPLALTTKAETQAGWWLRYGIGRICFWTQLWLSVISFCVLLFSVQAWLLAAPIFMFGPTPVSNPVPYSWPDLCFTTQFRLCHPHNSNTPYPGQHLPVFPSPVVVGTSVPIACLLSLQYANSGFGALMGVGFTMFANIASCFSILWSTYP